MLTIIPTHSDVPTRMQDVSGNPVDQSRCVSIDSNVDEFTIKVHSSGGITKEQLIRVIQEQFKVVKCAHIQKIIVVNRP